VPNRRSRTLVPSYFSCPSPPRALVTVLVLPSASKLEVLSQTTREAFPVTGMVQTDLGPLVLSKYKDEPVDDSVSTLSISSVSLIVLPPHQSIRDDSLPIASFCSRFLSLPCKRPHHRLSCKSFLLQYHSDQFLDFSFMVFLISLGGLRILQRTALFSLPGYINPSHRGISRHCYLDALPIIGAGDNGSSTSKRQPFDMAIRARCHYSAVHRPATATRLKLINAPRAIDSTDLK
jgi:hypothetical protein